MGCLYYCDCTDFERGSHSVEAQQDFDILFPNDATTVFTKTIDITFSERMGSLLRVGVK